MARRAGELRLLSIAAIFIVVFAAMWAGVQYSRGDLVPETSIDAREQQLRRAVWTEIIEWRAEAGADPPLRAGNIDFAAQEMANRFAAGNLSTGTLNGTEPPEASLQPTGDDRCVKLLVRHTIEHPDWTAGTGELDRSVIDAVATAAVAELVAVDRSGVLKRGGLFWTGIGVVAEGDDLYVVYFSCLQRRISP